jgi:hypothetical protein
MSQPEPPTAGDPGATGGARSAETNATGLAAEQCRAWLEWAATQVDTSLASDAAACDHLLASLNELMALALLGPQVGASPADQAIGRKMSDVIVAVQAHDRVMQGLTHVAQSLRALRRHLADARGAESTESWRLLGERQMQSFSMAEERVLFARMVADGSCENATANPHDTVELFVTEQGSADP